MGKYKYSKTEQQINDVLKYHDDELKKLKAARPSTSELDRRIQESEDLLRLLVQGMHLNQSSQKRSLKQIPRKSVCSMWNIISSIV